jgi:hypothetical protein
VSAIRILTLQAFIIPQTSVGETLMGDRNDTQYPVL